jgi:hypothetical protein
MRAREMGAEVGRHEDLAEPAGPASNGAFTGTCSALPPVSPSDRLSIRSPLHRGFQIHPFLSVCLSARPSVRPSVCPSVCMSIRPSICPYIRPVICLSVRPAVRCRCSGLQAPITPQPAPLSAPSVCPYAGTGPSIRLFICPPVSPSVLDVFVCRRLAHAWLSACLSAHRSVCRRFAHAGQRGDESGALCGGAVRCAAANCGHHHHLLPEWLLHRQ